RIPLRRLRPVLGRVGMDCAQGPAAVRELRVLRRVEPVLRRAPDGHHRLRLVRGTAAGAHCNTWRAEGVVDRLHCNQPFRTPILRYNDLSPQCDAAKRWIDTAVGRGIALFVIGLALKLCLADLVFGPVADRVFAPGAERTVADAWLGATTFSLQVYCDFAGYS